MKSVSRALGIKRFSAGSFSESVRVFKPELLRPIIEELAGQLPNQPLDPRLAEFKQALTIVDGTILAALTKLTKSALSSDGSGLPANRYNTDKNGKGMYAHRLHMQLDLEKFTPHRMDRTGARNAGENRESNVLRRTVESGRCYVNDGGFNDRSLFDQITEAASSFVTRMADNSVVENPVQRPLTPADIAANVLSDCLVQLPDAKHPLRRIEVKVQPHPRRTRQGKKIVDRLILATNLMDLPAELISVIYNYRYTVEFYFRILKQLLGLRHLISEREEGIDIQINCTVIVCILIQLISGKKPNKAMRNMVYWYLLGLASEREVVKFLNKPDNTGVKKRAEEALFKKSDRL